MKQQSRRLWGLLAAAGSGQRVGGREPKQYHLIAGRPVLGWSLQALLDVPEITAVMVALAADDGRAASVPEMQTPRVIRCTGGAERADTVRAGLEALQAAGAGDEDAVLVHDAARPAVHGEEIQRLIDGALDDPAGGLLALPCRDTLKRGGDDGRVSGTVSRVGIWQAVTPQLFPLQALRRALAICEDDGVAVTDEAQAMEYAGARPRLVEARLTNIKYTWEGDAAWLARILGSREAATP